MPIIPWNMVLWAMVSKDKSKQTNRLINWTRGWRWWFFLRWTIVWISNLLNMNTSDISLKNTFYLRVGIYSPAPGIPKFISNFNSSWRIEFMMTHQNNYFWWTSRCSWIGIFSDTPTRNLFLLPGGFTCHLLASMEHHQ